MAALRIPVTFVETVGDGSMDRCSHELARRLAVDTLRTDIYARAGLARNRPLFSGPSLRALAAESVFVRRLAGHAGLVHLSNQHLARYALFAPGRFVVTVHDLIRLFDQHSAEPLIHRPNARDRIAFGLDYRAIARADAVVAISSTTARDVVDHLGVAPDRVFVVHNGLDHQRFRPVAERPPIADPYVLYVGTEQPRKNLATLLRAMRRLVDRPGNERLRLVKVGGPGGCEAAFRRDTERVVEDLGLGERVVFTGRVDDDELPRWYSHARCLVMPSLYEGFGNPPLEAMACGCPVIVSDTPALEEIVDGAGLTVPATDDAALADAIARVLDAPSLGEALRLRGLERAVDFSWDRAAKATIDVYAAVGERLSTAVDTGVSLTAAMARSKVA